MTADAASLNAMGALHTLDVPESQLCASSNVDTARLTDYIRIAVTEFVPPLGQAELVEKQGVQVHRLTPTPHHSFTSSFYR